MAEQKFYFLLIETLKLRVEIHKMFLELDGVVMET